MLSQMSGREHATLLSSNTGGATAHPSVRERKQRGKQRGHGAVADRNLERHRRACETKPTNNCLIFLFSEFLRTVISNMGNIDDRELDAL